MPAHTTIPGYVNRNGQVVVRDSGLPGTDHLQRIYVLGCSNCSEIYGANGSDIFERKCPTCQGGAPGLAFKVVSDELITRARQAWLAYEEVFILRVAKRSGWKLDASHLEEVLASCDAARIRSFIADLAARTRELQQATIV